MSINYDKFNYKLNENNNVVVEYSKNVFKPTGTSIELLNSCNKNITSIGNLLDLGCGNGFLGIALKKMNNYIKDLYASDISLEAVNLTSKNAKKNNVKITTKCGSILEPWENNKFDYIINDISGISESLSNVSGWFEGVSCKSGVDGTKLVIEALKNSIKHLNNNGKFFFPVLSFSHVEKILLFANNIYENVELISHKEWVMPKDLQNNKDLLSSLKKKKYISYKEKFGLLIWYTSIYVAFNK